MLHSHNHHYLLTHQWLEAHSALVAHVKHYGIGIAIGALVAALALFSIDTNRQASGVASDDSRSLISRLPASTDFFTDMFYQQHKEPAARELPR